MNDERLVIFVEAESLETESSRELIHLRRIVIASTSFFRKIALVEHPRQTPVNCVVEYLYNPISKNSLLECADPCQIIVRESAGGIDSLQESTKCNLGAFPRVIYSENGNCR